MLEILKESHTERQKEKQKERRKDRRTDKKRQIKFYMLNFVNSLKCKKFIFLFKSRCIYAYLIYHLARDSNLKCNQKTSKGSTVSNTLRFIFK